MNNHSPNNHIYSLCLLNSNNKILPIIQKGEMLCKYDNNLESLAEYIF